MRRRPPATNRPTATTLPRPDPRRRVRTARLGDAPAVAALSGQLGYAASTDEIAQRLAATGGRSQAVLVAEVGGQCVGWLHVQLRPALTSGLTAQVMGLVVDARQRSAGIGAELLVAAESWARRRHAERMVVGTRVERLDAHRFYAREGYRLEKTWRVLVKDL